MIITEGHIAPLIFIVIISSYAYYLMNKVKRTGEYIKIRKIPALEAVYDLVGRAAELGRPVLLSPSDGATLRGAEAAETQAGLSVINYAAKICARLSVKPEILVGSSGGAEVIPLTLQGVREAYVSEGKVDEFDPDVVRFVSGSQMSFAAGVMGTTIREKVASSILIGPWHGAFLPIALGNVEAGAMMIGGTSRVIMTPMFVAFCDYFLFGEEVFVSGAYLSEEPSQIATIAAQDFGKFIIIGLIITGMVTAFLQISLISNLLSM